MIHCRKCKGDLEWRAGSNNHKCVCKDAKEKLNPVDLRRLVLRDDFGRGYFCAVAVYLKESCQEGVTDTMAQSLFRQGGDWKKADPEDIETFRIHGLIPAENR